MTQCPLLYEDDNLRLLGRPAAGENSGEFWVTFSYLNKPEPFGAALLDQRKCGVVYIVSKSDKWFQHWLMPSIMATIRQMAGDAPINLYGCSMGAFGALMFSGALKANLVIAVAPQITLDRNEAYDQRWHAKWQELINQEQMLWPDARAGMSTAARTYVIYDPYESEDRRQMSALSVFDNVRLLGFPFATHDILSALVELKLFKPLFEGLVSGNENIYPEIRHAYMTLRRRSSRYYMALARRFFEKKDYAPCAALSERALAIDPEFIHARDWIQICRNNLKRLARA